MVPAAFPLPADLRCPGHPWRRPDPGLVARYLADLDDLGLDETDEAGEAERHEVLWRRMFVVQLWDRDPPQVWPAAKRLLDAGLDRHEVLHRIGSLVLGQIHGVMSAATANADPEAYGRALDELTADPRVDEG